MKTYKYTLSAELAEGIVSETAKLVHRSIHVLSYEPDNENAVFNLQYSLAEDINEARIMVQNSSVMSKSETSKFLSVLNSIDEHRKLALNKANRHIPTVARRNNTSEHYSI